MISAVNLTRVFGTVKAVCGLDLEIRKGEIFGLIGPDGAGKTTTLRMLAGLIAPSSGEVRVAGFDVTRETDQVKDRIGYMAQKFGLYIGLTVQENMDFYADLFGVDRKEREALMPSLLQMTRMEPFRDRLAGNLSGGMKQKLALMCTLIHHPQVLLLDEPTNGVDPVSRRDFWAILYQLIRDGMTVLTTTAYLDEAERCNRVGLMHNGRLISCDTPEALKKQVGQVCYEVRASDNRRARSVLSSIDEISSVEPAGDALHLFASHELAAEAMRERLADEGLDEVEVEKIVPSMEDVFIATVRRGVADAARG